MSALYIHIPYCKQRCIYCDYYSSSTREDKKEYINTLVKEFDKRKKEIKEPIETIYIGGGTPTTLSKEDISNLFKGILEDKELFKLREITIEANPENLSQDYIKFLKDSTPINRLSIGIQSFDNKDLKALGRKHSKEDAIRAVKYAQEIGFNNISIDLIYSLPYMNLESWLENLKIAIGLNIQHISAYILTVEENTVLYNLVEKGKLALPSEQEQINQFDLTIDYLSENSFEHYETSNFSLISSKERRKEFRSKHNSSYWNNTSYIGLGASAHSYNQEERRWNISDIKKYIKGVKDNILYYEKEILSINNKYNEYIIIGTRTIEGLNLNYIKENFPKPYASYFENQIQPLLKSKLIESNNNNYILSPKAKRIADTLAIRLMK